MRARARAALLRVPAVQRLHLTARFGDVSRTAPLTDWGFERGTPVDRWYIERYLQQRADLVGGRVLEVKSDLYASWLGAAEVDVLDVDPDNERASVVGDVCDPATLERGRYDAAVVTQTLQMVPDPAAALANLLAALRPDGRLLVTVPSLSRSCHREDLWRWTPEGLEALLRTVVPADAAVEVTGLGNGLAARAFLFGLAVEDLPPAALEPADPDLPLLAGATVRLGG